MVFSVNILPLPIISFIVLHVIADCRTKKLEDLPKELANLRVSNGSVVDQDASARDLDISKARDLIAAQSGKPCAFPFIHDGVTYSKCKVIFGDIPICSTRVDSDDNHVDGYWGFCDDNCPTEGMFPEVEY